MSLFHCLATGGRRAIASLFVFGLCVPGSSAAQEADILSRGYAALAAGRAPEAQRLGEEILGADPRHHGAATLVVLAASTAGAIAGLDAYEAWLASSRHEDAYVLEPVARAVLAALADKGPGPLQSAAREHLGRAGASGPGGDAPADDPSDRGAALAAQLGGSRNKVLLLRELAATGYTRAAPQVAALLGDPVPEHRAAAADTLAALEAREAVPALRELLEDPSSLVRASAATALHRLGDGSGDTLLFDLLSSDVPDIQLQAAEAMSADAPSSWAPYIEPLLDADAPMTRLQAARLFLPVDPERARNVLKGLLDSPNPVIAEEMARTLADERLADLPTIRFLLRHRAAEVRLQGAVALLRLVGAEV